MFSAFRADTSALRQNAVGQRGPLRGPISTRVLLLCGFEQCLIVCPHQCKQRVFFYLVFKTDKPALSHWRRRGPQLVLLVKRTSR